MLNFMPRFDNINFYQNRPEVILPKKYKIFERWGLRLQTPVTAPHCIFVATCLIKNMPNIFARVQEH